MQEIKAPSESNTIPKVSIFTAGTIDMGNSENWQEKFAKALSDYPDDLVIYNPRRDDWDSSWEQTIENAQFREQVEWELSHIQSSDIVFFMFLASSQSPITLMELGLCYDGNAIVCCEKGFWRRGNIEVFCNKFNIPLYDTMEEAIEVVKEAIQEEF